MHLLRLGSQRLWSLGLIFSVSSITGVVGTGAWWSEQWMGSEDREGILTVSSLPGKG